MSIPGDHNSIPCEPQEAANAGKMSTASTTGFTHHWSTSLDATPMTSLSRSKSALDVSVAPRLRSTSQASYMLPSPRAQTFPRVKEERPGSMKSLFSKSSKLLHRRRTSSRLKSVDWRNNISPPLSPGHLGTTIEEIIDQDASPPRPIISEPYNFRHVTHGGPAQAKVLQSTKSKQLATEFSIISASQAPKFELKEIKTDDLIPRRVGKTFSPIVCSSPGLPPPFNNRGPTLRSVKSVDAFNRTASSSFSFPCPPLATPPRTSSRPSQRFSGGAAINVSDRKANYDSTPPSLARVSSNDHLALTTEIAQAVTTPDGSAQLFLTHQRTPSSAGLADVPEEVEVTTKQKGNALRPRELRHAKSFPARIMTDEDSNAQNVILQLDEEDIPTHGASNKSTELDQNDWEDDIDYCYEHAMDSAGLEWEDKKGDNANASKSPCDQTYSVGSRGSAASSSISVPGLATPSDSAPSRDSFTTSHSLLFPASESYSRVTCYEQSTQAVTYPDGIQTRTSTYPLTIVTDYSRRNSGSVNSEWSPEEPFSTADTSISAKSTTSKHRRGSSAGSFPDILPYGMGQQTKRSEISAASFHRSKSSEDVLSKMLPSTAPSTPATSRTRANSEAASKLLDLDLIGAPRPGTSHRSRAASIASAKLRQPATTSARVSYNLFPPTNAVVPSR